MVQFSEDLTPSCPMSWLVDWLVDGPKDRGVIRTSQRIPPRMSLLRMRPMGRKDSNFVLVLGGKEKTNQKKLPRGS